MTNGEMYFLLKQSFKGILEKRSLHDHTVYVKAERPADSDAADLDGKEIKLIADYEGTTGECSTSYTGFASGYKGTLGEVLSLDIENDPHARSVYIAAVNAVMNKLEMADDCVSCVADDKVECAEHIVRQYKKNNGKVNVLLAGYQPQMLEALAANFPVRVLDLDKDNIGKTYFGVTVEDGMEAFSDAAWWAEVILCTGSALSNGTLIKYINMPKDVLFYGTTVASCARVLGLRRMCPFSRN